MIKNENGKLRYFDKNGKEITEGCKVQFSDGSIKEIYMTEDESLGTDATNPAWIKMGRAVPCEFGVYPLLREDTEDCEIVE